MKQKTVFLCSDCGYESPKWYGKCPSCGAWNTMSEFKPAAPSAARGTTSFVRGTSRPTLLGDIETGDEARFLSGIGELDRVLGGGAVHGCPSDFSTQGRSLLRGALAAHACGEKQVLALLPRLRGLWAQSLRTGSAADQSACRLAACILAAWLMEEKKAGVPFST